jgi:hypothetical protein
MYRREMNPQANKKQTKTQPRLLRTFKQGRKQIQAQQYNTAAIPYNKKAKQDVVKPHFSGFPSKSFIQRPEWMCRLIRITR